MNVIVITPAANARLTTIANVRADLGLAEAKWSDEKVGRLIDQASATAARVCMRTFGRQVYRERIDAQPYWSSFEIVLAESPVTEIKSVSRDGSVLDVGQYETDGTRIFRVESGHRCCWYGRSLVLEYQAGWLLPGEEPGTAFGPALALPADIEKAVIQLIGVSVSEAGRDMTVKSDQVEGIGSRSYYVQGASASLPHPAAEAALMQYRNLRLV